ncbi:polysaccharide lyase 8 family protein [Tessaracoccus sp. OS52]|uniref:polysaccharide lyase 8 family protein n=1 Tax=Tessaracoccus sp. OS52 TaxID=2886691 RepID=UPI001D119753|nr:polysaccharide lyase 8 family protein [Tessaracoccus sp. OS52]MCC2593725.1 polysaccharide lyase 8 family protein [Tessaracoccus sp. OS52]
MPQLSRRTILQGVGSLAIVAALAPCFEEAAAAAPTLLPADLEALRLKWVEDLTSASIILASPGTFAARVGAMDNLVGNFQNPAHARGMVFLPNALFKDLDWTVGATDIVKSNKMRLSYSNLQTMATAWATPTSLWYGSDTLVATIRRALAHLHTHIYNDQTVWFGNWWSWLIGATKPLADILAILHPVLDQDEIDTYCAAMDHFLPNRDPQLQIHPIGDPATPGVQESNGANRVDICRAFIVRSIVQPDTALLQASVAALSPTWQYVTSGNGFFKDGSFVQHSTIGYTGTYGLVLLEGLSKLFALLANSTFDITDATRSNLTSTIEGSFAPFMFNGQMMDAVRGRAVSRFAERSIDNGNQLIEYTLRMAKAADPETATRWRGLCRQWIESNSAATVLEGNIARIALVTDLMNSDVAPVADVTGPRFFPAMDRHVHRGSSGDWAMCVAMCSNRIAWSESSGAENFRGVKTSQGMTYLYTADNDTHFDDEFWSTSDLDAPPGTTVDLTPLPDDAEGQWGETTPANEWTGGVTADAYAMVGMHLIAPGGTGLVARKSWFTMDDRVVALGSDISTASDGAVRSVVEHRNLGTSARAMVVDGSAVTAETVLADAQWAHVEGAGGYVFLGGAPSLLASVAERQGTWRANNNNAAAGTATVQRRQYATLAYEHGVGASADGSSYAYMVLPGAGVEEAEQASTSPRVSVLRNDGVAQGLRTDVGVVAVNFWKPGKVDAYTASVPLSLIARDVTNNSVRLNVSDPTQTQDFVEFDIEGIHGQGIGRIRGRDATRVSLRRTAAGVSVKVDTTGLAGATVEFQIGG